MRAIEESLLVADRSLISRSPRIGEGDKLLAYFRQLFHESSEFMDMPKDHYDSCPPERQEKFIAAFENDKLSFSIFIYHNDHPVGHIIIDNMVANGNGAYLVMGLHKEWQDKGIGKYLLRRAIEQSEKNGLQELILRVKKHNPKAISLYEKAGFKIMDASREAYPLRESEVILIKSLEINPVNICSESLSKSPSRFGLS